MVESTSVFQNNNKVIINVYSLNSSSGSYEGIIRKCGIKNKNKI